MGCRIDLCVVFQERDGTEIVNDLNTNSICDCNFITWCFLNTVYPSSVLVIFSSVNTNGKEKKILGPND